MSDLKLLPPLEPSAHYGVSLSSVKAREEMLINSLRNTTQFVISFDDLDHAKSLIAQFDAEDHHEE
jgi:hypothetical protein